jgi:hypothetical protein
MTEYGTHLLDTAKAERENIREFLTARGIEKPTEAQVDAAMHDKLKDPYMAALRAARSGR